MHPHRSPLILSAASDTDTQARLREALSKAGFSFEASSPASLSATCASLRPDLVLLDAGEYAAGARKDSPIEVSAEEVQRLIDLDGLTGLPNQQQFLERLAQAITTAQSPHDQSAVLFVHVDLQAALGSAPEARQAALVETVKRMKACIRDRDTLSNLVTRTRDVSLAHVGDEEFTLLLPGLLRSHDAYKVARRIHESLGAPIAIEGRELRISTSIGIALSPIDALNAESLLRAAQSAMCGARLENECRIHFSTAAMNAAAFQRLTLETSLLKALEGDQLVVYYQPKVEIATGRIVGVEALVRWKHPELGLVSPGQFIPIAEETGLIVPIGEHVLRAACLQAKRWQDEGLPPIHMAVNLSTIQLRDARLLESVQGALAESGLNARWLELEITESVLLQNADATIATLQALKSMGLALSIDDFGTGYSSLSYLKRFPIDALKIDQSFIREVTTNPDDAAITTSIILMGRSLKLRVIAEGVETRSQLAFLGVLECDEAQGYLFSRPLPADEIVPMLRSGFGKMLRV